MAIRKRTIVIIALAVVLPILMITVISAIIAGSVLIGPKSTYEYKCALAEIKNSSEARDILGENIEAGLYVLPNININGSVRNVNFSTPIYGSKGSFSLVVNSYRDAFRSDFQMGIEKDGKLIEIYKGAYPCSD